MARRTIPSPSRGRLLASVSALACLAALGPALAGDGLPTQGAVAFGAATIAAAGPTLTVTQTSPRAVLNWDSFSVGQGNTVTFVQPGATSATLNRVTGSTTSVLAGQVTATGQVFLVNPNGIAITPTGSVKVGGGFVASTLDIADADFAAGKLSFSGKGSSARVSNAGSIAGAANAFVALLGGSVANAGTISVPLGRVGLGSGERATLDLNGDGFMQVALPTAATTVDGQALVDVSGKVRARGGRIELKAATVASAVREAVNVSGVASARSARAVGGSVILGGGEGGRVTVSGRLAASGRTGGGTIALSGKDVTLAGARIAATSKAGKGGRITVEASGALALRGATVDASGATGGGAVRLGGDFHGEGTLVHAQATTIDAATAIRADATGTGDGGTVAVWSDRLTDFRGTVSAKGGPNGGNGGFVEVSANPLTRAVLNYGGTTDLTAPRGRMGKLLLDPSYVLISTDPDSGWNIDYPNFTSGAFMPTTDSVINADTLMRALATADVEIRGEVPGWPYDARFDTAGVSTIDVEAPLHWTSSATLTLNAMSTTPAGPRPGLIGLNAAITAPAGGLTIKNGEVSDDFMGAAGAVRVARFSLENGLWDQRGQYVSGTIVLPAFEAADFRISEGSGFRRGLTTAQSSLEILDVYGLQGLAYTPLSTFTDPWVWDGWTITVFKVDAGVTKTWNDGAGFVPIGSAASPWKGTVLGSNATLSNLTINRPGSDDVGLFGVIGPTGTVGSLSVGGTITGRDNVGGVAGRNLGTVTRVTATSSVLGLSNVGTVVGRNSGTVSEATSGGTVQGATNTGGIAGLSDADSGIADAYSSGVVIGAENTGGIAGRSAGTLSNVSTGDTASVTGGTSTGGLVGYADTSSVLGASQAHGAVTGSGAGTGGDVGTNLGSITTSFSIAHVTGADSTGGVAGRNAGTIDSSYFSGAVTGTSEVGGVAGTDTGFITQVYSRGTVTGQSDIGGIAGLLTGGGVIDQAYSLGPVTGGTNAGGVVGAMTGGTVDHSYVTGATSGAGSVGIFVGNAQQGAIGLSYYDAYTTLGGTLAGQTGGAFGSLGISAVTTDPADAVTPSAWSQASYPGLSFAPGGFFMVEGSTRPFGRWEGGQVRIWNAHQLQLMGLVAGMEYGLYADIDFGSEIAAVGGRYPGMWNPAVGFSPIGTPAAPFTGGLHGTPSAGVETARFTGTTIAGLFINRPGDDYVGLIGYGTTTANTRLRDLVLTGARVFGRNYVGALAGYSSQSIYASVESARIIGTDYVGGLVGYSEGYLSSTDFGVRNATVTGQNEVGGAAGFAKAIEQVMVAGSTISGASYVGGLAGRMWGLGEQLTGKSDLVWLIDNTVSRSTISGTGNYVGGLAGYMGVDYAGGAALRNVTTLSTVSGASYVGGQIGWVVLSEAPDSNTNEVAAGALRHGIFDGTVNGSGDYIGGIAGYASLDMSQVVSTGAVRAAATSQHVGGLVGYADDKMYSVPRITEAYASGLVTGGVAATTGALIGTSRYNWTSMYWDRYTTGQTAAIGTKIYANSQLYSVTSDPSQSAAPDYAYRLSAYQDASSTAFTTNWYAFDGVIRPVPLVNEIISSPYQLQAAAAARPGVLVGGYRFIVDIDLAPYLAPVGGKYPGIWGPNGFAPIGTVASPFSRILDGQGHTLANLRVSLPSIDNVGLIGYGAPSVLDLILSGGTVTGRDNVGALAGLGSVLLHNVTSAVVVQGRTNVGGLVGSLSGQSAYYSQSGSSSTGAVTGVTNVGGLVGTMTGGAILTDAAGNVVVGTANVGGLVGWMAAPSGSNPAPVLDGTTWSGQVTGLTGVGGAVGRADAGSIIAVTTTGTVTVTGGSSVGGLVGTNGASISNAHAAATVNATGDTDVGGLVGTNGGSIAVSLSSSILTLANDTSVGGLVGFNIAGGSIGGSVSTVVVTAAGGTRVGGFAGRNAGSITQSNASGTASGTLSVGGFVGSNDAAGIIANAYATGRAGGQTNVGGFAGLNDGSITAVYALGAVSGTTAAGALIGKNTGAVTAAIYNTDTVPGLPGIGSNTGTSSGVAGLTTAQMQDGPTFQSTYAGWCFRAGGACNAAIWAPPNQAGQFGNAAAHFPELFATSTLMTVFSDSATRVYGQGNDTAILDYVVPTGSMTAQLARLTSSATPNTPVGTAPVTGLAGAVLTNTTGVQLPARAIYVYTPAVTPMAITPALVLPTPQTHAAQKTYDATPDVTLVPGMIDLNTVNGTSAVLPGDAIAAGITGVFRSAGELDSPPTSNAGDALNVTLSQAALNGAQSADYAAGPVYPYRIDSILKAPITVGISGARKTYDGTVDVALTGANYTVTGFVPGQGFSLTAVSAGQFDTPDAGKTVPVSADIAGKLTPQPGTDLANYLLPARATGTGIIEPRALTAAVGSVTKTYDGTTTAPLAASDVTLVGFVTGQSGTVTQVTATYAQSDVKAAIPVTVAILDAQAGALTTLSNYVVPTEATGTGSIDPKALTATVAGVTKTYDGTTTAPLAASDVMLTGFVTGESGTVTQIAAAFAQADAGSPIPVLVDILAAQAGAGTNLSNYVVPTKAAGTGRIDPRALAATVATIVTRSYDGSMSAPLGASDVILSGFVGTESGAVTQVTARYARASVGTDIPVLVAILATQAGAGTNLSNYVVPTTAAGVGAIVPKPLTASVTQVVTKVYDGTTFAPLPAAAVVLGGFVGGESGTVTQVTARFAQSDVGTSLPVAVAIDATQAGAQTSLSNYVVPTTATGVGAIVPRPLTASVTQTVTKVYDGTTFAPLPAAAVVLGGFVGGESGTVTQVTARFAQSDVGTSLPVAVAIDATQAGAQTSLSNYVVPTTATGIGEILAQPLSVVLTGEARKVYDGTTKATLDSDNYRVSGFVGAQSATITQTAGTYASPDVGTGIVVKAVLRANDWTVGTGTLLSNYVLPSAASGPIGVIVALPGTDPGVPARPLPDPGGPASPSRVTTAPFPTVAATGAAVPLLCGADADRLPAALRQHVCIDTRNAAQSR